MAIVRLKDVEVTRLNNSGHGVQVAEKFEVKGQPRTTRFTLWFQEPSGLSVGQKVSVSGFLGAKVGDPWTGQDGQERRSVEFSVNSPRIETGEGSQAVPQSAPPQQAQPDGWAAPGQSFNNEAPF